MTYANRALPVLDDLLPQTGFTDAPRDRVRILDDGLALATRFPITACAVAALAAVGLAAARLTELRGGTARDIEISTRRAGLAMANSTYLQRDGANAKFRDPFTGFYAAAGGRHIFLHGNFPHLRAGLLQMLGADDAAALPAIVARMDPFEIEARAIEANLCAAAVRTRAEWQATPQAKALTGRPVIEMTQTEGPAADLPAHADKALQGIRVLDFTRVIAGPMAGRTLAEWGGDVLRISGPGLPSIPSLVIDTGFGKRAAELDLKTSDGLARARQLAAAGDVVIDGYRPGALPGRGMGAIELHSLHPNLVHVDLCAFGQSGPWAARRGYDSLVQATMGMNLGQTDETPRALPCQPLDYLTGYLAAYAAMLGLIRRAEGFSGSRAALSLAGIAHWMWQVHDQLGPESDVPAANPTAHEIVDLLESHNTAFGPITAMRPPLAPVGWRWDRLPVPLGTDKPDWA